MTSQIRWRKKDYLQLGRTIARFNKKVESLGRKKNIPLLKSYGEIKEGITTRAELNRVINSLNRFLREGAEDIIELPSGERITKWEKKELSIEARIAKSNLRKEMKPFELPVKGSGGYTKAQMGSERYRVLKRTYESLNNPFARGGVDFARIKSRIETFGVSDFEMKTAIIYRNNYLQTLKEHFSNLDGYDLLMKKLNSFSNPISFYKFTGKDEITIDFPFQYDLATSQNYFNQYLTRLGIDFEEG